MDATAAMAAGTVSRAMNEAVPPTLMHVTATALPVVEHYLISAPSQLATAKMEVPTAPMVIFCVDCSGSMGMLCKPSADARSSVTRLQCMQQALLEQICVLEAQQPECLVALVAFSSHVDVLTDTGRMVTAEAHQMRSLTAALETGVGHRTQVRQPVAQAARMLRERATLLRSGGATALGPALAIAIGLAKAPGSRVLVLTDGLANTGIGAIQQGRAEPFYMDVASRAADSGVSVSVLTLEGEDCSMENLGTTADVTGGAVEVFDPCERGGKVASVMQRKTLATGVKCTLTMPEGVHARTEEVGSSAAHDPKGPSSVVHLSCASVTEESELTVRFGCDGPPEQLCHQKASDPTSIDADAWEMVGGGEVAAASPLSAAASRMPSPEAKHPDPQDPPCAAGGGGKPFQLRLEYTLPTGERMLTVATSHVLKVSEERGEAESSLNGTVAALAAIHRAAALAQGGAYLQARAALIGTQRMLQRAMHHSSVANQKAYLSFIVQAEKVDGFMRERQATEQVFGASDGKARQVQLKCSATTRLPRPCTRSRASLRGRSMQPH